MSRPRKRRRSTDDMPIIADHCKPDGWRGRANPYELLCSWPDDCYVQWGSKGIVFGANGGRVTAFFEAFPKSPNTFIRGEGVTVADAERSAFEQFNRNRACPSHEFERRGYTNGAGICKHCGLFNAHAFAPSTLCEICSGPTNFSFGVDGERKYHWYCETHAGDRPRDTQPSPVDRMKGK